MDGWLEFVREQFRNGASPAGSSNRPLVAAYADPPAEYQALATGAALVDRSYRGLLEITGADRATWLHNLTTNQVTPLASGDGNYAFACDRLGRILFDLNVLIRGDVIWADIDRGFLDRAQAHFDKYKILEDVTVADRSDSFVRLGLAGSGAADVLGKLGAPHAGNLPVLGSTAVKHSGVEIPVVRHDFCGTRGYELYVPSDSASEVWRALVSELRATPVGEDAVQLRRMESGLAWSGAEITDEYLPAETGQVERAVNFNKGCYLGQEIVQRMHTRGSLGRRLVGVKVSERVEPPCGTALVVEDQAVGSITSACDSPALGAAIALGYVRTAHAEPGTRLALSLPDRAVACVVHELPFAQPA